MAALATAGAAAPVIVIDDSEDDDGAEAAEEGELQYLGTFRAQIVGIRYYTGTVGRNEMVKFVREPDNPYDCNAVRVDNIRSEKVGHLRRELVAEIAPLLDSGDLVIEGIMPGTGKTAYTMPIQVFCYGPSADVIPRLERRLSRGGCELGSEYAGGDSSGALSGGSRGGVPNVTTRQLQPAQLESALDKLFEDLLLKSGPALHCDAAEEITSDLYPHQTAALAWMVQRENGGALPPFWERQGGSKGAGTYVNTLTNTPTPQRPRPVRGGILADDMGLGKTLVVLSLIATNRPGARHPAFYTPDPAAEAAAAAAAAAAPAGSGAGPSGAGAAVEQGGVGEEEQEEGGEAAAAKVRGKRPARAKARAPHEKKRRRGAEQDDEGWAKKGKCKAEGKGKCANAAAAAVKARARANAEAKARSRGGGRGAAPVSSPSKPAAAPAAADPDEPPPAPPAARGPRGTLLVVPLSVLSNWTTQLEEHTAGGLELHIFHGPDRNRSPSFLQQQDLVITTYSTLGQELPSPRSGLLAVPWLRVVLDEGHTIKNPDARQTKAALRLQAERRWIVTGTPLQNRVGELFALMCFLGVEPLNDRSFWRRLLERPLRNRDERGLMRLQILMGALALRRTKATQGRSGRPLVTLTRKTTLLLEVDLGREDAAEYALLERESRAMVGRALEGGGDEAVAEYTSILAVIMRLRQVCDSRTLCPAALELLRASAARGAAGRKGEPPPPELLAKLLATLTSGDDDGGAEECSICLNPFESPCITRCGHVYCRRCIETVVSLDKPMCPLCRAKIGRGDLIDPPPPEPKPELGGASGSQAAEGGFGGGEQGGKAVASVEEACRGSSKVLLLLEKLRAMQPGHKAVVFSQFLGMLDIAGAALTAAGIPFVRLDGSCSAARRAEMLREFADASPGAPRVFLASLKAGGVGMNLTAASQCHILEPHWNPAVEDQAADRVHRLGQKRDVTVYRYIARGTIEERMLELQERKRALATAAFDVQRGAGVCEARMADLRLLMNL